MLSLQPEHHYAHEERICLVYTIQQQRVILNRIVDIKSANRKTGNSPKMFIFAHDERLIHFQI